MTRVSNCADPAGSGQAGENAHRTIIDHTFWLLVLMHPGIIHYIFRNATVDMHLELKREQHEVCHQAETVPKCMSAVIAVIADSRT